MSTEMQMWRQCVERCTNKYMLNQRLTEDEVASCREAIEGIYRNGGYLPRRSIGMRIEYELPLPERIEAKVRR